MHHALSLGAARYRFGSVQIVRFIMSVPTLPYPLFGRRGAGVNALLEYGAVNYAYSTLVAAMDDDYLISAREIVTSGYAG